MENPDWRSQLLCAGPSGNYFKSTICSIGSHGIYTDTHRIIRLDGDHVIIAIQNIQLVFYRFIYALNSNGKFNFSRCNSPFFSIGSNSNIINIFGIAAGSFKPDYLQAPDPLTCNISL